MITVMVVLRVCLKKNQQPRSQGSGNEVEEPAGEFRSGENKLSDVRSFIILRSQEGLTSFNKPNRANFSCEKNKQTKTVKNRTIYAVKLSWVSRF